MEDWHAPVVEISLSAALYFIPKGYGLALRKVIGYTRRVLSGYRFATACCYWPRIKQSIFCKIRFFGLESARRDSCQSMLSWRDGGGLFHVKLKGLIIYGPCSVCIVSDGQQCGRLGRYFQLIPQYMFRGVSDSLLTFAAHPGTVKARCFSKVMYIVSASNRMEQMLLPKLSSWDAGVPSWLVNSWKFRQTLFIADIVIVRILGGDFPWSHSRASVGIPGSDSQQQFWLALTVMPELRGCL